jgi:hypothetical protein
MTIGERVRLKADWSYRGVVVEIDRDRAGAACLVQWDNGRKGWYDAEEQLESIG